MDSHRGNMGETGGGERERGERVGSREGTDRGILPAPLYFQAGVKMNFTS